MKTKLTSALVAALGAFALAANAQDNNPPGDGPPQGDGGNGMRPQHPPPPLIVRTLDANHDGTIDADEIANASAALKALDKNGDGKLTMPEVMGPRPPMRGGRPGGQGNGSGGDDNMPPSGPPPGEGDTNAPPVGGPPQGHGDGFRPQHPPLPLIVRAVDANHDGVIDADEIANASAVLKALDKNGDGKLTMPEVMGPRPPMRGGHPGGPQGKGPGDGDNMPPGPPPGDDGDGNNPPPDAPPGED